MGTSERKEREQGKKEIFETIMTENFPKTNIGHKPQIHKAQRTQGKINAKTNEQN